jgi:hypothetical protein
MLLSKSFCKLRTSATLDIAWSVLNVSRKESFILNILIFKVTHREYNIFKPTSLKLLEAYNAPYKLQVLSACV